MSPNNWTVVTGASSGIGRATAERLLEKGNKVVLTSRNEESLLRIAEKYSEENCKVIPWDISDLDSLSLYVNKVIDNVGAISGFLHSAGMQVTLPTNMIKPVKLNDLFRINTFSALILIGLFSKKNHYINGESSFVLISSIAAHEGAIGKSIYAASKGALEGFLPSAAAELSEKGIRINIVVPGMVRTNMIEEYYKHLSYEQQVNINDKYPFGIGEPEDVSNLIAFLLSKESRWITGQKFIIDGGHLTRKI